MWEVYRSHMLNVNMFGSQTAQHRWTPSPTFDTVRLVGLALPEVEATTKYDGSPALKVGSAFMAGLATHRSAEPEMVVRIGPLSRIDRDALRDLLSVSWRLTLPKARKRGRFRYLDSLRTGGRNAWRVRGRASDR
jgi:hypothetical protein